MYLISALLLAALFPFPQASVEKALGAREGALVLMDVESGEALRVNPKLCATQLPPCSTFKIWNTGIGLELGLLKSADQPFYQWDGVKRSIEPWNQDLTLRQAFAVSCVPAYQALARSIGRERMDEWVKRLDFGNHDTSSGTDVFWLPDPQRTPLLISPNQQVELLRRLAKGDVPFSANTLAILKDIMTAKTTPHGTLYGKTGGGGVGKNTPAVGWFVGYLVSGKTMISFACLLTGENPSGKEARAVVEQFFIEQGLL